MRTLISLISAAFLMISLSLAWGIEPDLLVSYTFREGSGDTIKDVSGVGDALDLVVEDPGNVSWMPGGGLLVHTATLAKSDTPATKIIEACKASNEITIVAWIKPASEDLEGPARIVTCSVDPSNRNFTLGQSATDPTVNGYEVRLRTTVTGNNGVTPSLFVADTVDTSKMAKLAYTRNQAGDATIYINGAEVAGAEIAGDFSNWNDNYHLGIGHEMNRAEDPPWMRTWIGEYHFVAVYSRALTQNEIRNIVGAAVKFRGKLVFTWGEMKTLP